MDMSVLQEAGLTEGEIKVYIALLELGLSSTGPIIKHSNISRSIIYQILDKLMKKGLASHITKDKTKYFQAAEPHKLLEYVDERKIQFEDNRIKIQQLLPELILRQTMADKSEANIFYGFKGIRTAHEHTYQKLKKGEEYVYLGIPSHQPDEQHLYFKKDHIKRAKIGIKCKLLFNYDTNNNILRNRNSYKYCEARKMIPGIKTPAGFLIYKEVTLIIIQEPTAIAVEIINKEISDSFMSYFEYYWKKSKPFK